MLGGETFPHFLPLSSEFCALRSYLCSNLRSQNKDLRRKNEPDVRHWLRGGVPELGRFHCDLPPPVGGVSVGGGMDARQGFGVNPCRVVFFKGEGGASLLTCGQLALAIRKSGDLRHAGGRKSGDLRHVGCRQSSFVIRRSLFRGTRDEGRRTRGFFVILMDV